MTIKMRQSGQPARVLLLRSKAGNAPRTIEGNASTPAPRVGLPPPLMRMEREIEALRDRVIALESKVK